MNKTETTNTQDYLSDSVTDPCLGKTATSQDHNFTCALKTCTVKILKFGTPQTIAIIVLKVEKFDVALH